MPAGGAERSARGGRARERAAVLDRPRRAANRWMARECAAARARAHKALLVVNRGQVWRHAVDRAGLLRARVEPRRLPDRLGVAAVAALLLEAVPAVPALLVAAAATVAAAAIAVALIATAAVALIAAAAVAALPYSIALSLSRYLALSLSRCIAYSLSRYIALLLSRC